MDILKVILFSSIVFAALLVGFIMAFVRQIKLDQRRRQSKVLEQAKTIHMQQEVLKLKEQILERYREG